MNQCQAEVSLLKENSIVRFKHTRRSVDKICVELRTERDQDAFRAAEGEFLKWWAEIGVKALELEKEVSMVNVPDLEQTKLERAALGLTV